jgi:uncharacterized membrane protein
MPVKSKITAKSGNGDKIVLPKPTQIKSNLDFNKSWSDRMAIFISGAFGSIAFLCICVAFFVFWILWNLNFLPLLKPLDPYPFPALEMGVSIFAIILSVSVLMSQNRLGRMDKVRNQVEFEVNIRAENEITKMLGMLHEIQKKMGINSGGDTELEQMKENLDIKKLHHKLEDDQSTGH